MVSRKVIYLGLCCMVTTVSVWLYLKGATKAILGPTRVAPISRRDLVDFFKSESKESTGTASASATQTHLPSSESSPTPSQTQAVKASDSGHRLAIVIPFREREANLKEMVQIVSTICKQQGVVFRIFVVEQTVRGAFNRAKLCNIGYKVASSMKYDYFVFHDVDKVPESAEVSYRFHEANPKHMAHCVAQFGYRLPYGGFAGGVLMVTGVQFAKVNGMSNLFWGWGGEDDELYHRFIQNGFNLDRDLGCKTGRFRSLQHGNSKRSYPNVKYQENYNLYINMARRKRDPTKDGLSTLEYDLIRQEETEDYVHLIVDVCKGDLGRRSPDGAGCDVGKPGTGTS